MAGSRIYIQGMNGFGDTIHQRAPLRKMLERGDEVWMPTAAPCFYHDLLSPKLHLLRSQTKLRTQNKNVAREQRNFAMDSTALDARHLTARYTGDNVKRHGSVVHAICHALEVDPTGADFRMPVPQAWIDKAPKIDRPYMVYRPPVARREWGGAAPRNPDVNAYAKIFAAVREGFKVVSIADLSPGLEWIVGKAEAADETYHSGELDIEAIAGLVQRASFVFTTPGFLTVLAQALSVPCITVFGGYETPRSYSSAHWAPWLPIEVERPCECWEHSHPCDKRIDLPKAISKATAFVSRLSDTEMAAA